MALMAISLAVMLVYMLVYCKYTETSFFSWLQKNYRMKPLKKSCNGFTLSTFLKDKHVFQ